jgi:DnaJ-class molecular chaperone
MSICPSCGGVLGLDCFNPQECAYITQQMNAQEVAERLQSNFGYWQLCPKCNGEGVLPSVTTTSAYITCHVCNGAKLLARPIINQETIIP